MAKWSLEVSGMTELFRALEKAGDKAEKIAAESLYEGAGVVADALNKEVNGIRTEPFKYAKDGRKRLPSPEEKAIVQNARHGVAKFKKNKMGVQTSVGYSRLGYGRITWNHAKSGTRTKYKVGYGGKAQLAEVHEGKSSGISAKPVAVIANSINSGTSFMQKQPFIRKALKQSEAKAEEAITNGLINRLDKLDIE